MQRGSLLLFLCAHWLLPALATAQFVAVSCLQVRYLQVNDLDFGVYLNLFWNIAHGYGWDTSLYRDMFGFSFLGDHLVLGAALFAPVLRLWESPYALAVLHGLVVGSSFFLLPWLVREVWTHDAKDNNSQSLDYVPAALFFGLMLFFLRPYLMAWRYQTHLGTLVTPFVLVAILALYRQKWGWLAVAVAVMLLGQERSSLFVCGVGIYAALVLGRFRLGACLCLVSCAWFLAAVKVVIPWFQRAGGYLLMDTIAPFFELPKKVGYVGMLLFYNFFLPLCGWRALRAALAAAPLIGLNVISRRDGMYAFSHHYSDAVSLFLLIASVHGFFWLRARVSGKLVPGRFVCALCAGLILVAAVNAKWVTPPGIAWRMLRQENAQTMDLLRRDMEPFVKADDTITVFTHSSLGPWFSLRSQRRLISPEVATQPLRDSLVVISSVANQYKTDYAGILQGLEANPSLRLVAETPRLRVYASVDIAPRFEKR